MIRRWLPNIIKNVRRSLTETKSLLEGLDSRNKFSFIWYSNVALGAEFNISIENLNSSFPRKRKLYSFAEMWVGGVMYQCNKCFPFGARKVVSFPRKLNVFPPSPQIIQVVYYDVKRPWKRNILKWRNHSLYELKHIFPDSLIQFQNLINWWSI